MSKPRQMVITINFHYTREKRGTSDTTVIDKIVRYIRHRIEPFVVVDSITYVRTDITMEEQKNA